MSLAPLSPTRRSPSRCAFVRTALIGALFGWLWFVGPGAWAQSVPDADQELSVPEAPAAPDAEAPASDAPPSDAPPPDTPPSDTPPTDDQLDGTAALSSGRSLDDAARRHAASRFHRELRSVEEEVGQLKERVFRSKATLKLLKELVVDAAASGSQVMLWHVNELGNGYVLESVQYFLDGKNVFTKIAPDGSLDEIEELKFHEQTLPPGEHNLQVNLVLRGKGHKIFSYLESFQFKVQSQYPFTIEEGKVSLIRVVLDSKGGFKNFEDRPTVRYDERKHTYRENREAATAGLPLDGAAAAPGESTQSRGRADGAP